MATWDDLSAGTWDQLYSWDDPDRDIALDAAYGVGAIVVDAPRLTVDWVGDAPTDQISPTMVRDEFVTTIAAIDTYNRSVSNGLGSTDNGVQYTTAGGSASDYSVSVDPTLGGRALISNASLSTQRRTQLPATNALHFDVTVKFTIAAPPTGAGGNVVQGIRGRFQDTSNFVECTLWRNVNSNNCTVQVFQLLSAANTGSSFVSVPNATPGSTVWVRFVAVGAELYGYGWVDGADTPSSPLVTLTGCTQLTAGSFEVYHSLNSSITNTLPLVTAQYSLTIVDRDLDKTSIEAHPWAGSFGTTMIRWSVHPDGYAVLRPGAVNTTYTVFINDVSEVDFDVTIKVRAPAVFTGAKGTAYIVGRFQDNSNFLRFRLDFNTDQVLGYAMETSSTAGGFVVNGSGLFPDILHDPTRWVRFRVQGIGSIIRLKAWMDDDRVNRDWTAYFTDSTFPQTPGKSGLSGLVATGNTNVTPEFYFDQYWQGANSTLDIGSISVGLSLDDGLPSGVTNTQNIGVNEAGTDLLGPIGTAPDIYFSPFRADMPLGDLDRDVAGVAITAQVLSANGVRSVRTFTGRMADIPLDDRSAKLQAISAARLALSAPVQPPAVHGFYEGREATWLVAFALFKAGLYVAPRPLDGCRLYLPLNGTTHAYIPDTNSGAAAISGVTFKSLNNGVFASPNWMDGPFTAAPDLGVDKTRTDTLQSGPGSLDYPSSFAPGEDFLSQTGYKGRIECWVKGDATNVAGSFNPSQVLLAIRLHNQSFSRQAKLIIGADRKVYGSILDGVGAVSYPIGDLPADGQWHFIAFGWDLAPSGGTCRTLLDNRGVTYLSGVTNSNLPVRDDLVGADMSMGLPVCEIRFTSGPSAAKAGWANAMNFSPDVIMRRSLLEMDAVAETAPREAFELLSSLAQSELAHLGFDAQDRVLYLPLRYWGEPDQQVLTEELSTDTNLGKAFKVTRDVHRIFNQVTLSYKQATVDETWVTGFQTSQMVSVDPGSAIQLSFTFNAPAIELRGLTLALMSGTALAAAPPSVSNAINYITMNTAQDGSGTYAAGSDITATIISWDPGSATVEIRNNSGNRMYLANNVSIPPLGIAVKQVTIRDSIVTAQNDASIAIRGIRNLPVSLPMISKDGNAGTIAQTLANFLAFPRASIVSDIWGDFRREPGALVSVSDVDNTGLNRVPFRLTGISTTQDGSNVQQAISAVEAWPVQAWGSGVWGSGIWGES